MTAETKTQRLSRRRVELAWALRCRTEMVTERDFMHQRLDKLIDKLEAADAADAEESPGFVIPIESQRARYIAAGMRLPQEKAK